MVDFGSMEQNLEMWELLTGRLFSLNTPMQQSSVPREDADRELGGKIIIDLLDESADDAIRQLEASVAETALGDADRTVYEEFLESQSRRPMIVLIVKSPPPFWPRRN